MHSHVAIGCDDAVPAMLLCCLQVAGAAAHAVGVAGRGGQGVGHEPAAGGQVRLLASCCWPVGHAPGGCLVYALGRWPVVARPLAVWSRPCAAGH